MNPLRSTSMTVLCATLVGCAMPRPPMVFDVQSLQLREDAHRCVVAALVDSGYRITESRIEDGVVRAQRAATERWAYLWRESDVIEVLVFSRERGPTGLQFTVRTVVGDEDKEPSEEARRLARTIGDECG